MTRDRLVIGDEPPVSDEELALLALAGDPDQPVPADAVPFDPNHGGDGHLLPAWYMPAAAWGDRPVGRGRRAVIFGVVAAFLGIEAAGLCSTYGPILPG
jgi:hypothetical protein